MEPQAGIPCPLCRHGNRPGRRFCAKCGTRLGEVCAACGTQNDPNEKFCGDCGASLIGATAEGERRQLTVLFCDLVGSTAIAGQLDPEDWREIAAQYQRAAADTVTRFGGYVAKYLGDGLLVYFGYPAAHEDDPERAVLGGLALLNTIAELNRRLEPAHGVRLAVRVGMHTGPVVIGEGAGTRAEVFGDTPNVAARVQALADPDVVLITEATHRLVSGRFIVEGKGAPPLKGVREAVAVYRVLQPSGMSGRLAAMGARGLTPFVGRETERRLLGERWAQVRTGEGQVILITGEAGIGKSRLVQVLKEDLAGDPHTWIECSASVYHQHTPFHAIADMLHRGLGWGDATPAERLDTLERSLEAVGVRRAEAVPLVALLLGLPVPEGYPPLALSPEGRRKKLLATLVAWLVGSARVQPVVAVLEDLHWIDPSTLELQGLLVEQAATAPVLLLYTARPEFRAPWPLLSHHAHVTLGRLGHRQVREMVTQVAGRAVLAEHVIEAVVTRTDGIPLYVEELTKAVLEADGGGATTTRAVPATLQDSLMARLDRLGSAKEVAQLGAVLGREFSYSLLHAVSPLTDAELQAALGRLTDAELLYPRGLPPEATYLFKHALVQDTAYASLLKSRRRDLHRTIARALTDRFQEVSEAQPEVVAHHYEGAGENELAVTYYLRAGEQAAAGSAHEEAIGHLRKGLALLVGLPEAVDRDAREVLLQLALGTSLIAVRGFSHEETGGTYERALVLCDAVGNVVQRGTALYGLWNFRIARGELASALALAERTFELGRETREQLPVFLGHFQMGALQFFKGEFASSMQHCERAIAAYDPDGYRSVGWMYHSVAVAAWSYNAWNLWYLGHPDRALNCARQAAAVARSVAIPFCVAFALFYETALHWCRRDAEAQHERAAEVIAISETEGFPLWRGVGRAFRGAACALLGAGAETLAEVMEGLALAAGTGNQAGAPAVLQLLAETHAIAGQHAAALGAVETALTVAAQTGQHFLDSEIHRLKGELLLASQPRSEAEAERFFKRALEIAGAQGARSLELRAAMSLARLGRAQGKPAEARALLAPVYAWFTEGFDTRDLVEAKALLEGLA